jgi:pyruvate formate lyase activating enzyme
MKGIVFDTQHYAIYDGPGIRTIIFLKGCPLHCSWCQNPESQKLNPQISYFEEKCVRCGKCIEACPNDALKLLDDKIQRDERLCVVCGTCVEACPNDVMELIGEEKSVQELVEIVIRDKPFYENSGGGVTISGGEPTMQSEFLLALLKALKEQGIDTAIETCGFFKEELLLPLVEYTDLFLFDLKHMNSPIHKEYTGVSNELILSNFTYIHSMLGSERIIPRIPLIPGMNIDEKNLNEIALFLKGINYHGPVHLMPYNKLTKTKYEKVGMSHLYKDMGELSDDHLEYIVKFFEENGFQVVVNH